VNVIALFSEIPVLVLQVEPAAAVWREDGEAQYCQHLLLQERYTHNVVILEGIQCSLFVVPYFASYHSVDVRFEEFVDLLLRPQSVDTLGSGEFAVWNTSWSLYST
jgi:hypothetical protein